MAVDQIADRLIEAFGNLVLQPGCGLGIDWIGDDNAGHGNQEDRMVEGVLRTVAVACCAAAGATPITATITIATKPKTALAQHLIALLLG